MGQGHKQFGSERHEHMNVTIQYPNSNAIQHIEKVIVPNWEKGTLDGKEIFNNTDGHIFCK